MFTSFLTSLLYRMKPESLPGILQRAKMSEQRRTLCNSRINAASRQHQSRDSCHPHTKGNSQAGILRSSFGPKQLIEVIVLNSPAICYSPTAPFKNEAASLSCLCWQEMPGRVVLPSLLQRQCLRGAATFPSAPSPTLFSVRPSHTLLPACRSCFSSYSVSTTSRK